jgi:ATP-dependent helicase HrpB
MTSLPIDLRLPEIVDTLREHGSLVLVAPPGAGKTTRVPPAILRAGLLPAAQPTMVVLQPRRVAARSTAARIADEQHWTLGRVVGYQVRFERRITAETRIRIQTEGILTRQILADPFLESVGAVVLDEIHERSIHGDLALALVREIQREVRRDLLIVAMSATLDAAPVARFLGDCPIIQVEGRTHPVSVSYRSVATSLVESTEAAVIDVLSDSSDRGHVLVFLPGMAEIRRVQGRVESEAGRAGAIVIPLHGSLSAADQDWALRPNPARKIILSTNIAETSLTIDGVSTVIDGGLARVAHYDSERGFDRLSLEPISRTSADQRAGRAGRTGPGRCIRLWSEPRHRGLADQDVPEIHRVDLCETVLALHSWGIPDPSAFPWYETPSPTRLAGAERLLVMLGAVEEQTRRITALGERLFALPVHPRLGRLLIAASDAGRMSEGAAVAALLSEKDLLARDANSATQAGARHSTGARPEGREGSDLRIRLDLLEAAEREAFSPRLRDSGIDPIAARQIAQARDHLIRLCGRLPSNGGSKPRTADASDDDFETSIQKWLLLAYPDRVVKRRGSEETGVMVGGRGVMVPRPGCLPFGVGPAFSPPASSPPR